MNRKRAEKKLPTNVISVCLKRGTKETRFSRDVDEVFKTKKLENCDALEVLRLIRREWCGRGGGSRDSVEISSCIPLIEILPQF